MRTRNRFGSDTQGSIGKKITTAIWRGRNYAKAFRKPKNPQSDQQQQKRSCFTDAVKEWQSFNEYQKLAYDIFVINRSLTTSGYHAMLGSYTTSCNAGQPYTPPGGGWFRVVGLYSNQPVEGAVIEIWRDGRTELYSSVLSDATGRAWGGLTAEDQTYTIKIMADGYDTFQQSGYLASQLFGSQSTIRLVGGQIMRFSEDFVWKNETQFMTNRWKKTIRSAGGDSIGFTSRGIRITTGNAETDYTRIYTYYRIVDPTVTPLILGRVYISDIVNMAVTIGLRGPAKVVAFGTAPHVFGSKYGYYTSDEGWVVSDVEAVIGWHKLTIEPDANRYPVCKVGDVEIGEPTMQLLEEMYEISYTITTVNNSGSQIVWWNMIQLFDDGVSLTP